MRFFAHLAHKSRKIDLKFFVKKRFFSIFQHITLAKFAYRLFYTPDFNNIRCRIFYCFYQYSIYGSGTCISGKKCEKTSKKSRKLGKVLQGCRLPQLTLRKDKTCFGRVIQYLATSFAFLSLSCTQKLQNEFEIFCQKKVFFRFFNI